MGDREKARMRKCGESKRTRIMMATVPYLTSGLGLRKFQADGFLLTRVYNSPTKISAMSLQKHVSGMQRVLLIFTFVLLFGAVNFILCR